MKYTPQMELTNSGSRDMIQSTAAKVTVSTSSTSPGPESVAARSARAVSPGRGESRQNSSVITIQIVKYTLTTGLCRSGSQLTSTPSGLRTRAISSSVRSMSA